jgi:hypothetical protein
MLYLATRPDPFLTALIDDALTAALGWADDPVRWRVLAPHVGEGFGREEGPHLALENLRRAHRSPGVFRMSHAYWMLLFDCLDARVTRHSANLAKATSDRRGRALPVGPFRVGPIDLAQIVAHFFWDLWCFPEAAFDDALASPPVAHRVRGGAERYAPTAQGLAAIAEPRWAKAPLEAASPASAHGQMCRYPLNISAFIPAAA